MLKRLGFRRTNKVATETSFGLPDHVTTIERNRLCFLESETTNESINLKAFPVKSKSFSLSATYMETQTFSHGDLDGHIFPLPLLYEYDGSKLLLLEHEIPKVFLVNEETFRNHITMVFSKACLSSSIQERLVTHIPKLEAVKMRSHGRGFKIEIEIHVNMYHTFDIGSGCKGKEACPFRVIGDRHVAKRVTGVDCPICLTELSSEVSRMELPCSHVFHSECVVKWLNNSTSCPICRAQDFGEVSIY